MLVNHRMLNKYSSCYISNKMIQDEKIDTKANVYKLEDNANNKKVKYFSFRFWKHMNMKYHYKKKKKNFLFLFWKELCTPHTQHLQAGSKPNMMLKFSTGLENAYLVMSEPFSFWSEENAFYYWPNIYNRDQIKPILHGFGAITNS